MADSKNILNNSSYRTNAQQKHLVSLIISSEVTDSNGKIAAKYFFPLIKTTNLLPAWNLKNDVCQGIIDVIIVPASVHTSITTLNIAVCKNESIFQMLFREINILYRRCQHLPEASLPHGSMIAGNVAIAWDDMRKEYRRVQILNDFTTLDAGICCKILDFSSQNITVLPNFLFKLVRNFADLPSRLMQVQLEHLRHYDALVILKEELEESLNSQSDVQKQFKLEFTGRCNDNGIPLVYLHTKHSCVNTLLLNNILKIFNDETTYQKVSENDVLTGMSVTNILPDGHIYLQNKAKPMYKHLLALLSTFPAKKDSLIPVKAEDIDFEEYYVTMIDVSACTEKDSLYCRVQVLPPRDPKIRIHFSDSVHVEYSDYGGYPPTPVKLSQLFLASDVDPVLRYLPLQCLEARLLNVPSISIANLRTVKQLTFTPDDKNLYTVVVGNVVKESDEDKLHVELFEEPQEASYDEMSLFTAMKTFHHVKYSKKDDKKDRRTDAGANPKKENQTNENKIENEMTGKECEKMSINVRILRLGLQSNEHLPCRFTKLETRDFVSMYRMNYENPKYAPKKKHKAILESIYSYDDFTIILHDDVKTRENMQTSLCDYSSLVKQNTWTKVDTNFLEKHPYFVFCVSKNDNPSVKCRATVIKKLQLDVSVSQESLYDMVQVLLIDYGIKQSTPVSELELLSSKIYYSTPPLAVCGKLTRKDEKERHETFQDFKNLTGKSVWIKIRKVYKDCYSRTWIQPKISKILKTPEASKKQREFKLPADSDSSDD